MGLHATYCEGATHYEDTGHRYWSGRQRIASTQCTFVASQYQRPCCDKLYTTPAIHVHIHTASKNSSGSYRALGWMDEYKRYER